MANTEDNTLEVLGYKLSELNNKLYEFMDEMDRTRNLWAEDGDNKHSDVCFKKFVKFLGEFYTIQDLVCVVESPFIECCLVRECMEELGKAMECSLSMAIKRRMKYSRDRMLYDLRTEDETEPTDVDEPFDDSIEYLFIDDDKVANLSTSIICFINNCLREQNGSEMHVTSDLQLTDTEENIIDALGKQTLTGESIAKKLQYPYNSNFKGTLSSLRKRGILENIYPKGYFLRPEYHFLLLA